MTRNHATLLAHCPACANPVDIDRSWEAGGVNDYGGLVLECANCKKAFDVYVGRDVADSTVRSGARVLARYDDELGNKDEVLAAFGLK